MRDFSCIYNDSDEDCYKCTKKGYFFKCGGCEYYTDYFGNNKQMDDSCDEEDNKEGEYE